MNNAARSFKRCFSAKHLKEIYFDKIKGSGAIGIDRVRPSSFEKNCTDEIALIVRKINDGNYKFTAYKEKLISKGAYSYPRQISIPTVRDRITLRALCDALIDVFPNSKLSLPQVVIESLKESISSGKHSEYAKIDLKNFYPSIPHKLIEHSIKNKIRKPVFRELIYSAITTPTVSEEKGSKGVAKNSIGVPQGLSISNVLAEIALQKVDTEISLVTDIWYKRYVDDILILTPSGRATEMANIIIGKLKSIGLSPHPVGDVESKSKVGSLSESFNFLGYEVNDKGIGIKKDSILRFESSLAKIFTAYRHALTRVKNKKDKQRAIAYCQWKLNLRITGCIFNGKRMGWVAYFSQVSSTVQFRTVNHTIRKLTKRFGLEADIKPKSLIKTYYEWHRGNKGTHRYIPNFDALDIKQQRDIVSLWFGKEEISKLNDTAVNRIFKYKISSSVKELEQDISGFS
ncbi:reverse transcriptase domain-containing protein [Klebsiella sp. CVUAS 11332]|uniref:reverse transcriptase domain-containing protein n=1 Tax=Klebsiella sp. CVUAS 11332 TaxID=2020690 RepID=UPI001277484C|nr:reverse transcriptase domain-containing protein [Klebsiella sp. CVUAS 11332]EDI0007546.1 reverse transcriptase [Salmonella enterica subsp. enterica serovar Enteritidis]MBW5978708.1 reverse transcriptase [Klebsiella michiganensis]MBW6030975.1 reverse transcriptase [Klebsiella sp. CVUAS 11332]QXW41500.1 RNA-directed DNA polymerase [Klebsiella grimontii]